MTIALALGPSEMWTTNSDGGGLFVLLQLSSFGRGAVCQTGLNDMDTGGPTFAREKLSELCG